MKKFILAILISGLFSLTGCVATSCHYFGCNQSMAGVKSAVIMDFKNHDYNVPAC